MIGVCQGFRVNYPKKKRRWPQHIERIPNQSLITSTGYITSISQTNSVVNQKFDFLKLFIPQKIKPGDCEYG